MNSDRHNLRWNGWGWTEGLDTLGEKADAIWTWMGQTFGMHPLPWTPAKPLTDITLPPPKNCPLHTATVAVSTTSSNVLSTRTRTGWFRYDHNALMAPH